MQKISVIRLLDRLPDCTFDFLNRNHENLTPQVDFDYNC